MATNASNTTTDNSNTTITNDHTTIQKRRKITDPSSPYFLPSNDIPGLNICGVMLRGEANYREWATALKNAFRAKRKLGFLDGTLKMPIDDKDDIEDWYAVNSMLVGWVMNSIEPNLRSNLAYVDSVKILWDDIKERFDTPDAMRVNELKDAITNCKQRGQSVTEYYGRLKVLWEKFAGYRILPVCKCGHCTCDLVKQLMADVEIEQTHEFLLGLDDIYGDLRSHILSTEPLPSLSKTYQMVIKEERHKKIVRAKDDRGDAVAFAMSFGRGKKTLVGDRPFCAHCNRVGHDVTGCFKLTGKYPEWWFTQGKGRGRGGNRGGAAGRGRGTHTAHAAAVANATYLPEAASSAALVRVEPSQPPQLTAEQWTAVLTALGSRKPTPPSTEKLTGPQYEDGDWSG